MIRNFSSETKKSLQSYVYVFSDPDTKKPFYIGKGKGDRLFDHFKEKGESEKIAKLEELEKQGKEPVIDILAYGMDNATAEWVEMAAIDLIGKDNLTNAQRGNNAIKFGRTPLETLEQRYGAPLIHAEDFTENVVLLKINKIYQPGMDEYSLYEASRGYWYNIYNKVKDDVRYALPVYDNFILEVYEVAQWFRAGTTIRAVSLNDPNQDKRCEFVGRIAPDEIRNKYLHKSTREITPNNMQDNVICIKDGRVV